METLLHDLAPGQVLCLCHDGLCDLGDFIMTIVLVALQPGSEVRQDRNPTKWFNQLWLAFPPVTQSPEEAICVIWAS